MRFKGRGNSAPIDRLTDVIHRGYFQQVRFFIDLGIRLDDKDEMGRTPLMLCSLMDPEQWGVGIARLLIEKDANLTSRDKYGMNAMHLACIYERVQLVRVFLSALDFDLLHADKWGNTALHYAARSGNSTLVRLLVHTQYRYKIRLDKVNKTGLTALDEAYKYGNKRCAEVIESVENLSESELETLEPPPPLRLRFPTDGILTRPYSGQLLKRSQLRPKTAAVIRRGSLCSSSTTSSLYLPEKPITYRNMPRRAIEQNERDINKIIHCASLSDFRNNPEYLYQLVMPGTFPLSDMPNQNLSRPNSDYIKRPISASESENIGLSWRNDFKKLYTHLQYQCSTSYRDTAKYVPQDIPHDYNPFSPQPDEDELDKSSGKKSKRVSSAMSKAASPDSGSAKQRKQSAQQRNRKISSGQQPHSHGGKNHPASLDGSLGSSNESINSGTSGKKQSSDSHSKSSKGASGSGSEEKPHVNGRTSRTSHHHRVPAVLVQDDEDTPSGHKSPSGSMDHARLKV